VLNDIRQQSQRRLGMLRGNRDRPSESVGADARADPSAQQLGVFGDLGGRAVLGPLRRRAGE
jgi:hypothetical protein